MVPDEGEHRLEEGSQRFGVQRHDILQETAPDSLA